MFNLVKDDFDENSDDILKSINKILGKNRKNNYEKEGKDKKEEKEEEYNEK